MTCPLGWESVVRGLLSSTNFAASSDSMSWIVGARIIKVSNATTDAGFR